MLVLYSTLVDDKYRERFLRISAATRDLFSEQEGFCAMN